MYSFSRIIDHLRQVVGGGLDQRIFFLHVPKCGGTSIDQAIRTAYRLKDPFQRRQVHLDPHLSRRASELCDVSLLEYREHLLLYFMGQGDVRYLSGHFAFSESAYEEFGEGWKYVTVLRHPVDKWFSQYFYNRHKDSDHFKIDRDLREFADSKAGRQLGRGYVQKLAPGYDLEEGANVEEAVNQAKRVADRFDLVGILEDLHTFVKGFRRRFGVTLYVGRENTNPVDQSRREAIPRTLQEKVFELCRPNLSIYRYIVDKWNLTPDPDDLKWVGNNSCVS